MPTLVGAAEPPERRPAPVIHYGTSDTSFAGTGTTGSTTVSTVTWSERGYVSHLWGQDWGSTEDAAYG